jgi:1-acyl-sn-glycerol-3-phosphate acyltransferase
MAIVPQAALPMVRASAGVYDRSMDKCRGRWLMLIAYPPRMALQLERDPLVTAITQVLSGYDAQTVAAVRRRLEREIDSAGPAALAELSMRLEASGNDWTYYPPDPLARRVHHVVADGILDPASRLEGAEHLSMVAGRPVVILANHLSYSDANLLEILLTRNGATELANRLTVIAGPKVYSSVTRRFSSLCFGTIKVAQSSGRASEDAVMNPREVARAARQSIEVAHERLANGDALLVFAEGTRSRTRGMQPMLPAVARYFEVAGTVVLPIGITGTDTLFPIGDEVVHSVAIVARVGAPIDVQQLEGQAAGDRRGMMDIVGHAIATLLPAEYHGVYEIRGGTA